ncbi:uncharacterized protein LACBIDRAFT_325500 [Laccaria bicolor S238N-H82]|uniref:Predicted protein n=1 Tax=Laccaria bicolor (strain S238N-H82 / ATCC MYA-4686) TaxID=486041 RepID=B0D551_LACBS|nr:uncharacterized protein LACBIDRAFT_325500 [Laccaria bicolor S238N-H82]EDR10677.1 predicted protein [Laccaria bicolor S238N-H82]|eukprot:XP_001879127.1 predicted protein [Laccaria bicolor S238N-H82]
MQALLYTVAGTSPTSFLPSPPPPSTIPHHRHKPRAPATSTTTTRDDADDARGHTTSPPTTHDQLTSAQEVKTTWQVCHVVQTVTTHAVVTVQADQTSAHDTTTTKSAHPRMTPTAPHGPTTHERPPTTTNAHERPRHNNECPRMPMHDNERPRAQRANDNAKTNETAAQPHGRQYSTPRTTDDPERPRTKTRAHAQRIPLTSTEMGNDEPR